jgi:hypothetical protein
MLQATLETYIQTLVSGPFKNKEDICRFLNTDLLRGAPRSGVMHSGYKEGYLTKRGKNFGGWKTRYFVLQSPVLEYYESVRQSSRFVTFVYSRLVYGIARRSTSRLDYYNGRTNRSPTKEHIHP